MTSSVPANPAARRRVVASRLAALAMLGVLASGLAACNTVAGAGQDASSVGHDVGKAATAVKNGVSQ